MHFGIGATNLNFLASKNEKRFYDQYVVASLARSARCTIRSRRTSATEAVRSFRSRSECCVDCASVCDYRIRDLMKWIRSIESGAAGLKDDWKHWGKKQHT